LSVIIKEWGCFARQKAGTKTEELRDLRIETRISPGQKTPRTSARAQRIETRLKIND